MYIFKQRKKNCCANCYYFYYGSCQNRIVKKFIVNPDDSCNEIINIRLQLKHIIKEVNKLKSSMV